MKHLAVVLLFIISTLLQGCASAIMTGNTPDNPESSRDRY